MARMEKEKSKIYHPYPTRARRVWVRVREQVPVVALPVDTSSAYSVLRLAERLRESHRGRGEKHLLFYYDFMRLFCSLQYRKKCNVNHLHDSFGFWPNHSCIAKEISPDGFHPSLNHKWITHWVSLFSLSA